MFGHQVCKFALIRAFKIDTSRLEVALKKHMHCDTYKDGRGGRNALPSSKTEKIRKHIE